MRLNVNFHQQTGRRPPTKQEINELECLALSIEAIVKAMRFLCIENDNKEKAHGTLGSCISICSALELLMEPITDYMCNYAGDTPTPETVEEVEP